MKESGLGCPKLAGTKPVGFFPIGPFFPGREDKP